MRGKSRQTDDKGVHFDQEDDQEEEYEAEESGETGYRIKCEETAYRIELNERISNVYEFLIESDEKALRGEEEPDLVIDSGATTHCSPEIRYFESLDQRYTGQLGTASKSTRIMGKGVLRKHLSSGKVLRIVNLILNTPEEKGETTVLKFRLEQERTRSW
jgi:hypothetical protein